VLKRLRQVAMEEEKARRKALELQAIKQALEESKMSYVQP